MLHYYKGFNFRKKYIIFEKLSSVSILKIFEEFRSNIATGIDNLVGRFLKDGSNTLCTYVAKI